MIDDDCEVKVLEVRGDTVILGFTAPRSVNVHRRDIWEQVRREVQAERDAARAVEAAIAKV